MAGVEELRRNNRTLFGVWRNRKSDIGNIQVDHIITPVIIGHKEGPDASRDRNGVINDV
jgi:hypothetical protein